MLPGVASEIADPIFWFLREGTTLRMNEHSSSFQHVRLMTASRPFARYAQPNNLAGRLSIFSLWDASAIHKPV